MATPFPFTTGQVLTAAQMNSIGETIAYTPTWTGITVGNGTNVGFYTRVQNFVHVEGKLTFGTTTAITASTPSSALPINALQSFTVSGSLLFQDSGVATYFGQPLQIALDRWYCFIQDFATAYGREIAVTATVPFVWATADSITWSLNYLVA
jgi:hypothetical protein